MEFTTLNDLLGWAEGVFSESDLHFGHGTDNAWDEAVSLALFVLKLPPDVDSTVGERLISPDEKKAFVSLVNRRVSEQIPVPYLTNEAWFAGLKFYIDERALIPRSPFAELIQNGFQPWLGQRPVKRVLDLCTGGGCLAIATAYAFPKAMIDAVDISKAALAVAEKNIALHGCQDRVHLMEADLFSGLKEKRYDLIISNPPYVGVEEMEHLPPEFKWEPKMALSAGNDGLDLVKQILKNSLNYLNSQGLLFVEVGNSMEALENEYPNTPFTWLEFEHGGHGIFMLEAEDKACWQEF